MNFFRCQYEKKHIMVYPDILSAIKPVPHGPGVPVPSPPEKDELEKDIEGVKGEETNISVTYEPTSSMTLPRPLIQSQLNDLTRDLGLSKENAQHLGSRLSESNFHFKETTFYCYRKREKKFRRFFEVDSSSSLAY